MRGGEKWWEAGEELAGPAVTRTGPMVGGGRRAGSPWGTSRGRLNLLFVRRGNGGSTDNFVLLTTVWRAVARRGEVWSFYQGLVSGPAITYIIYRV